MENLGEVDICRSLAFFRRIGNIEQSADSGIDDIKADIERQPLRPLVAGGISKVGDIGGVIDSVVEELGDLHIPTLGHPKHILEMVVRNVLVACLPSIEPRRQLELIAHRDAAADSTVVEDDFETVVGTEQEEAEVMGCGRAITGRQLIVVVAR